MMRRSLLLLVVAIALVLGLVACEKMKPLPVSTPTAAAPAAAAPALAQPSATPEPQPTDTPVPPPTAAPAPPTAAPTATAAAVVVEAEEMARELVLLSPPSGFSGSVIDLNWAWEPGLGEGEQFRVDVWADAPDAAPMLYRLVDQTHVRLTAASKMPGAYRWRVTVVKVVDGVETGPVSEASAEETFTLQRPNLLRGQAMPMDFGDAPEASYNTLLKDDGARHVIGGLYLGEAIDAEADGQPDVDALGDDMADVDDEDGVTFGAALVQCQSVPITVVASGEGKLDAWLDLNGDGAWDAVNEQVIFSKAVVAGANSLSFVVACDAKATALTYMRFRLSSSGALKPTGLAADGEVEDYAVAIAESVVRYITVVPTYTRQPTIPVPTATATLQPTVPQPTATIPGKPTATSVPTDYPPPVPTDQPTEVPPPYYPPPAPTQVVDPTAVPYQPPE